MRKYESQRGAILVESAIVVGAIFMMLFGTAFIAIIGFDQMSADGASYEVAHQTSVGAVTPPPQFAHQLYPNIPQAQISAILQPAPAATLPVDYGYNSTSASELADSDNNRHGGASVVQGIEVTGSATKKSASLLGMPISVVGGMIEPMWVENGIHFNAENDDSYGAVTPQCAATATPGPNPTPTPAGQTPAPGKCFSGSIFTSGENTPPYFVGFNFMTHCQQVIPWSTGQSQTQYTPWITQPHDCTQTLGNPSAPQDYSYTPLGVAEYLDLNNWCGSSNSPCSVTPANPGLAGATAADATFALIACHQRVYAQIASYFVGHPTLATSASNSVYGAQGGFSPTSSAPAYYYYDIYANSTANPKLGSNSFTVWAGFDSSLAQEQANYANGATPNPSLSMGATDNLIRQVYGWDANDIGTPGSNSTNPGYECHD